MQSYDCYLIKVQRYHFVNYTYLIVDRQTRQAAIVDPSWEEAKICSIIEKLGVQVTQILLTHSHVDHVNLVDSLTMRYGPVVYMSQIEIECYRYECKNLHALKDNDVILLGKTEISCLLTPGHTAGGLCFSLSDDLFSGDTIFIEGCGTCNTDGGCPDRMYESVQRLKRDIPNHIRIYPGHSFGQSPGHTMEYLLEHNIYFQIEKREHFVKFRMRENQKNIMNFR